MVDADFKDKVLEDRLIDYLKRKTQNILLDIVKLYKEQEKWAF